MKTIHIIGGGTFNYVRNHLALATPAFGTTAKQLYDLLITEFNTSYGVELHLTKMADSTSHLVTNYDVEVLVDELIDSIDTKIVFFNAAMCDYNGSVGEIESGKYAERLHTAENYQSMLLKPSTKLIKKIRTHRKDIFLVAFKTTCGATTQEQYLTGLNLLKANSCNLVLANDTKNHRNMIICPEEAKYVITIDRQFALKELIMMTLSRSKLTFTKSKVEPGFLEDWNSETIPDSLRTIVNYCIKQGAYKPFRGVTAGHFAVKDDKDPNVFFTSKRSSDFNKIEDVGLVKVISTGKDNVTAFGAKPSVGGMSQRIIFSEHPEMDCIVHFHCPLRYPMKKYIPVARQWPFECGSHECGQNTSEHLEEIEPSIKVVMLDNHGPNIVFNRNINPQQVINFIDNNFDLSDKTSGLMV